MLNRVQVKSFKDDHWFLLYRRVYPDPITSADLRLGMQDFVHWIVLFQTVGDQSTEQLNSNSKSQEVIYHFLIILTTPQNRDINIPKGYYLGLSDL